MIRDITRDRNGLKTGICFYTEQAAKEFDTNVSHIFQGKYLQTFVQQICDAGETPQLIYCVGIGGKSLSLIQLMETAACGAAFMREHEVDEFFVDLGGLKGNLQQKELEYFVQALELGGYRAPRFGKTETWKPEIVLMGTEDLFGCKGTEEFDWESCAARGESLAQAQIFARDLVNYPGNKLRPADFATAVETQMRGLDVEVEIFTYERLKDMKMNGILTVGRGSAFEPCMVVMRYRGDKEAEGKHMGLVGKGVTCDTGGYCLKPSSSMEGIRGDMAGGAAVAGCIYALAKNKIKANVTGVIPMCENRISPDSYLPGDVITMYDGTTVEICNTDAEGRLILADAVSYAVESEGVEQLVDIATLTGAVVNLFGFSIGGVICDTDEFFQAFETAAAKSGERYSRIPYYEEHLEMIRSSAADLKNMGPNYCGTITAGLFIRHFAKEKPWLHMDIAGTAWVDTPVWKFQSKGATGAGVTTLYELCSQGRN